MLGKLLANPALWRPGIFLIRLQCASLIGSLRTPQADWRTRVLKQEKGDGGVSWHVSLVPDTLSGAPSAR